MASIHYDVAGGTATPLSSIVVSSDAPASSSASASSSDDETPKKRTPHTRSLTAARAAYYAKGGPSVEAARAAHSSSAPSSSDELHVEGGQYIKSIIFGGLDGVVTVFAVVAAVAGAGLSVGVLIVGAYPTTVGPWGRVGAAAVYLHSPVHA